MNGTDFNALLVKNGFVRVYVEGEFRKEQYYLQLEEMARANRFVENCRVGGRMDYSILILGLLLLAFIILLWRYAELKGRIEQRARQMFEEWRERELERTSARKAEILFEEWRQKYEKEIGGMR